MTAENSNSCHVKNEFELTTDLEALHSQVAQQPTFSSFKEVFMRESKKVLNIKLFLKNPVEFLIYA